MAAAPFTLELVEGGAFVEGQRLGWFKAEVRDVVWVSDGANKTADATINAADVGLQRIVGALWLGDSGLAAITDTHNRLTVAVQDDGSVDLSALSGTSALDLDATDVAAARVLVLGY